MRRKTTKITNNKHNNRTSTLPKVKRAVMKTGVRKKKVNRSAILTKALNAVGLRASNPREKVIRGVLRNMDTMRNRALKAGNVEEVERITQGMFAVLRAAKGSKSGADVIFYGITGYPKFKE